MDVHASLRHLRQSPRKVRLVVNTVRGLSVSAAETRLTFLPKQAAKPVLKLLRSAIANAEHNFKLDKKDLYVSRITADGGPTLSRWRPRAFGRAAPIRKRTTHIMLVLSTDKPAAKKAKTTK
jgi:large subunit ribosomal protein L22